jgi:hypothetical protein
MIFDKGKKEKLKEQIFLICIKIEMEYQDINRHYLSH